MRLNDEGKHYPRSTDTHSLILNHVFIGRLTNLMSHIVLEFQTVILAVSI